MSQAQVIASGAAVPPRRVNPEHLLRRLEWTVIRRLDGQLQGDYRTLLRGFGIDLADLREYQAHDDVRYIDWNVTARLQTPHVREFLEDREVTAWFLLDLSGSVNFGSGNVRKRELSSEFVGVLARLLTRHGNRVGALLYDGTTAVSGNNRACQVIPARVGRRQVLHLLDRMLNIGDISTASAQPPFKETDLALLLAHAQTVMKRRSVVFVVSDFISVPGWNKALALLSRRHEVIAVRLYDPMELELPDLGFVMMQDAETGEQMFVDTRDRRFRKRFAEAAARRETALRIVLSEAGIDCLELATDDRLGEALLRFIQLRKRRSQLSAGAITARKSVNA
ncbi:MAG TPA: DUF58 domain-containing protein [Burkholderiales bacterium]|nr:DUF58 domain-containing protein [Burkholderiales bacterium]